MKSGKETGRQTNPGQNIKKKCKREKRGSEEKGRREEGVGEVRERVRRGRGERGRHPCKA